MALFTKEEVKKHFDSIAEEYEYYKKKNDYYYSQLKELCRSFIPRDSEVLEIGCGTGSILKAVAPKKGVGVDISSEMIKIAASQHDGLIFKNCEAENLKIEGVFEYVIMADVIEHLYDLMDVFDNLKKVSNQETKIVISSINPLWSVPLDIAEKLAMKMPEGPHSWIPLDRLEYLLDMNDFKVVEKGYRILIPVKVPKLSNLVNRWFYRMPIIKNFGLVQFVVIKQKAPKNKTYVGPFTCSVVIPCFNEERNIAKCIEHIPEMGKGMEILVVDDGSTDGTSEVVEEIMKKNKNVKLISHPQNQGKGIAVQSGFEAATGDVLIILDADMSVPPEELPKFLRPIINGDARFVNGTRTLYPMEDQAMRNLHLVGNKIFSRIFTWLLNQYVTDTLCGTKVLFKEDYKHMKMRERSWPDFDLLFGAAKLKLKIKEVPIHYRRRVAGESKMRTLKHGWLLFKMCLYGFRELKLKVSD